MCQGDPRYHFGYLVLKVPFWVHSFDPQPVSSNPPKPVLVSEASSAIGRGDGLIAGVRKAFPANRHGAPKRGLHEMRSSTMRPLGFHVNLICRVL